MQCFSQKTSKLGLFLQSRYKHWLNTSVNEGQILSFLQLLNALGDRGREEECLTRLWPKVPVSDPMVPQRSPSTVGPQMFVSPFWIWVRQFWPNHRGLEALENDMKYAKMVKMTAMCKKDQEGRMLSDIYPRLPKALNLGVEAEAKRPYKNEVVIKTLKFKAFGRTAALWDQVWSNIIVEKNHSQGTISKANRLDFKTLRNLGPFTEIWVLFTEIWVLLCKLGSFSR